MVLGIMAPLVFAGDALAFDYLEHSYFTDAACHRAQLMIAERLEASESRQDRGALAARYLALGLFCPASWQPRYCQDDEKLLIGSIHDLAEPPLQSHDVSLTLGDYASLPDHFASFGPVKGLPLAGEGGLWDWTATWMTRRRPGGVGGTVEDVAEDACETNDLPDWHHIEADIDAYLERAATSPVAIPEVFLSPLAREAIPRGPADPAGAYSFDNPHYLDLVLRNHNHFGVQAYSSWIGFHGAAVEISQRSCAQTIALEDRRLERMARRIPGFEQVDFGDLSEPERAIKACALLGEVVRDRLSSWRARADTRLLEPIEEELDLLLDEEFALSSPQRAIEAAKLLEDASVAVMSLVFEGSGVHFLQDGLAAGHMRTIRTRGGLLEARHDHDLDNRHGVVAIFHTREGVFPFVAFGDSFLLGPQHADVPEVCSGFEASSSMTRAQVSMCLIQHQRGVVTATSMASLLDWALGGTLYGQQAPETDEPSMCTARQGLERFVCAHLPSRATFVGGEDSPAGAAGEVMYKGSLPVPPLPYAYEALTTRIGFDVSGRAPQVNVSFTLLSELDDLANWLTSYRVGLTTSVGQGVSQQGFLDFTYSFHWRWAARVLVEGGVSTFAGFRDFDTDSQFFMGLSPVAGLTVLPEGWTKGPLELSLSYRLPINAFVAREGFFRRPILDGHWIYFGLGLAFMS